MNVDMTYQHRDHDPPPQPRSPQPADSVEGRLDAARALARMMIHEIRNPLSVVKGYGEMMARDAEVADDGRFRGLMEGIERLGSVVDCVTAMMIHPGSSGGRADVASAIELAADFVRLTHRPEPRIEIAVAEDVPAVAMQAVDLQHLAVGAMLAASAATSPHPSMDVSVRCALNGPPAPRPGPRCACSVSPAEWRSVWPLGRAAVVVSVDCRGPELADGEALRLYGNEVAGHRHGLRLGLGDCVEIVASAGGTVTSHVETDGAAGISIALPALTHEAVALWAELDEPARMESWSI